MGWKPRVALVLVAWIVVPWSWALVAERARRGQDDIENRPRRSPDARRPSGEGS